MANTIPKIIGTQGSWVVKREELELLTIERQKGRLCSIDWSLPPTDYSIESHQQMEILNRGSTTFSPVKDANVVTSQLPDKSTSKTSYT
eukprot:scaffold2090_cov151-Chaetoceros_neogracile.AAC.5